METKIDTPDQTPAPRNGVVLDFVVIGAAKSGTTSLAAMLQSHPELCISSTKEPEFFSHDENYHRGFEDYAKLFAEATPGQLLGEASTSYTRSPQYPNTAQRIKAAAPDAKLIYLMRHPVDRAYSHYLHRWLKELHPGEPFTKSFEEHIVDDPMCVDGSDYRMQIEKYFEYFDREQLLCVFTDHLRKNPLDTLRKIYQFLGVDSTIPPPPKKSKSKNQTDQYRQDMVRVRVTDKIKAVPGVKLGMKLLPQRLRDEAYELIANSPLGRQADAQLTPPEMLPETRRKLLERYRPSVQFIEELTGEKRPTWYK